MCKDRIDALPIDGIPEDLNVIDDQEVNPNAEQRLVT